jgi:hypothetical protein
MPRGRGDEAPLDGGDQARVGSGRFDQAVHELVVAARRRADCPTIVQDGVIPRRVQLAWASMVPTPPDTGLTLDRGGRRAAAQ